MRSLVWPFGRLLPLVFTLAARALLGADTPPPPAESERSTIHLEALERLKGMDLEANPAVKNVVLKVLEQARGTPQFVEIVSAFKLKGQEKPLLEIIAKNPDGALGAEAMRQVLGGDVTALKDGLNGTNAIALVEALGNTGEKAIVPLLRPLLVDSARSGSVRKAAIVALAKVREGAEAVLETVKNHQLPEDLRPTAAAELGAARWEAIRIESAQLLPTAGTPAPHKLPTVAELCKQQGDPKRGAAVFRRETVGCYKCHQVNGEGTDFGPNLSEIGTKLAKEAIYQAILDPSAGISFGYEAWQLDFKNGDDALGLIVSETETEVSLKTVGGIVTRYPKADILRRTKQKLSIMPAGLEQTMSEADLVDLVEFLATLKKAAR